MQTDTTRPAREPDPIQTVARVLKAGKLVRPGSRVLAACSGGADSLALVWILRRLSESFEFQVGVAHIDHRQHPDSTRIARAVNRRCQRWGLPFLLGRLDPGPASEEALRQARYQHLLSIANEQGYDRIATGHTADDQVETVLMRILRGTGPAGLAGIPLSRSGGITLIRPLLHCTRAELIGLLRSNRLKWNEDPTNQSPAMTRNRIRHQLLPLLKDRFNPSVGEAVLRLAASAERDNRHFAALVESIEVDVQSNRIWLEKGQLKALDQAVQARLLIRMLQKLLGPGANLEQRHVEEVLARWRFGRTWSADLGRGLRAGVDAGRAWLERGREEAFQPFKIRVSGPGRYPIPGTIQVVTVEKGRPGRLDRADPDRAAFDADQLAFPLVLRSLEVGDRIRPFGGRGSRKVARLLIDARIPTERRKQIPLLVQDDTVLWVAGVRRSNQAPVSGKTRRVLRLRLVRKPGSRTAPDA